MSDKNDTTTDELNTNHDAADPEAYDLDDVSDRGELHLMMDFADGIRYKEIGDWEVMHGQDHLSFVRLDDKVWRGLSGDVSHFVAYELHD